MNINLKRILVAVTGSAVIMGLVAPIVLTGKAAAEQRLAQTVYQLSQVGQTSEVESVPTVQLTPEEQLAQAERDVLDAEVEVADNEGNVQRIRIADTGKQNKAVAIDKKAAEKLQQQAERGGKLWLFDPVAVVKNSANKYGFNTKTDSFTLISQVSVGGKGKAYVLVGHERHYYLVELNHPVSSAAKKIWQISSIKEVGVVTNPGTPDVGPGVVGLDYDKVIKWQQNVDAGRELWRLDPLQAAKHEGKQYYGFGDNAQYTIVRKLASSPLARHGQIDLEVSQNGKRYVMIMVRPFGSDKGAIWTTYRVYEPTVSQPSNSAEQVLFKTDKFKNWTWYKPQYPQGMGVAVVYNRQIQLRAQQMPQPVFDRLNTVDLTDKVALVAYLGGTSSAYGIGIEKVSVVGNEMTVIVRTRSPQIGAAETRDLIYPADFVLVDRSLFKGKKPMQVTFVDQNEKVLGKVSVSIQ